MQQPLRIGIAGLGTVAKGVLDILSTQRDLLTLRAGRPLEVVAVASRRAKPDVDLYGAPFSTDVQTLVGNNRVDVLVELIGGVDTAADLVVGALSAHQHVVTANKALIAARGDELINLARKNNICLNFEASVAGGVPVISALARSLAANKVHWLAGIINGTSNFILTAMTNEGRAFEDVLAQAQQLGYAEADPTFDVEGIDAAHKLSILAAIAFDMNIRFDAVYTEGITAIRPEDLEYARELGYRIKHLGIARQTDQGVEMRVHPTLVPEDNMLAKADGVMNALLVNGDATGPTLYYGAGAGERPTASAVVADLIDIARGNQSVARPGHGRPQMLNISDIVSAYYLRIPSLDRSGVFAKVATILSNNGISIEAVIQRERAAKKVDDQTRVPIIILTHEVAESVLDAALMEVQKLPEVYDTIARIRVEHLT
ncbi:MAG: homoserine dehydrogenase [Proteobacteria bacterium]|nr:homoserine dehydrogenase [Pseudomonadota bacterium]